MAIIHNVVRQEFSHIPSAVMSYEDLVQIGALGILHAAGNWQENRAAFNHYCYQRVRGMILDHLERNYKFTNELACPLPIMVQTTTPEHHVEKKEVLNVLRRLLKGLPENEKKVIHLHYFCGLQITDTAKQMQCTEANVSLILRQCRARLKQKLEARGVEDSIFYEEEKTWLTTSRP